MHFYSVKKRLKIPIFSTFVNNEILRNFEGKITAWYMKFKKNHYTSVKPYCFSTTYKKSTLGN